MTLPVTGQISFTDLQTNLGGSDPISLSEYYAVRPAESPPSANSYVSVGAVGYLNGSGGGTTPIPASGTISVNNFHGAEFPNSSGTLAYAVAGTYTTTVPSLPTGWNSISMVVNVLGAGAGGGGACASGAPNRNPASSGGGGGAGTRVTGTYASVTPGAACTIVVGAGGAGGTKSLAANPYTLATSGVAGAASSIVAGATSISAAGGSPGTYGEIEPSQHGGYGGSIGGGNGSTTDGDPPVNGGAGGSPVALTAVFTASITGTTMTVTAITSGFIYPSMTIAGTGVTANSSIVNQPSGTIGGVGVYTVNLSQTVASTTVTGTFPAGTGGAGGIGVRYGSTNGSAGGQGAGGGGGGASWGNNDSGETAGNGGAGGAGYVSIRFIQGA